jgi:phosphatidylserine decarboxylase
VLTAAIDALAPDDTLTVVAGAATEDVRHQVRLSGAWVEQRVRVAETLADAEPADAVMVAEPMTGSADDTRAELESLVKTLNPGGVVSVSVAAAPFLAGGAGEELSRQGTLFGVGTDLVLRSMPPLKVYRLRYSSAETELAERLAPLARTSSVRLTRT